MSRTSNLASHALRDKFMYERENARLAMRYRQVMKENAELRHRLEMVERQDITLYQHFLKTNPLIPERIKKAL